MGMQAIDLATKVSGGIGETEAVCPQSALALALDVAPKLWLVMAGLVPMNDNELGRDSHAMNALRAYRHPVTGLLVTEYPINGDEGCSALELMPYLEWAYSNKLDFLAKGKLTKGLPELSPASDVPSDDEEAPVDDGAFYG